MSEGSDVGSHVEVVVNRSWKCGDDWEGSVNSVELF